MTLFDQAIAVDEAHGIRLEMVAGLPLWEAQPSVLHQGTIFRIQQSLADAENTCLDYAGVYVQFPDGSLKRPDISIFYRVPEESDRAVTQIPQAVIEVLSPGYEAKDLQIGVPFYRDQGIKDIVVFDPYTNMVTHWGPDGAEKLHESPVDLTFACGCRCRV